MYVIGTAGHVDHGKSALVHALTGIDPDRLQEEKDRGMTIDLGFAWLRLPSGREVSIVDVPGHERFIKNMLAGVGGIDLALLVIAADEGIMPQTREHLAILDLLRVKSGVVAVTKRDLVEEEWLELVLAEAEEVLRPTTLAQAPIIAVSALSGQGLPELVHLIDERLTATQPRADLSRPRLPVDRVFTVAGFGTVVTGTLIDGTLSLNQEVEIVPGHLRSRVRGLQTHRHKLSTAIPGSRVAANLASLATTDLERGQVVTTPGWLKETQAVDARLRVLADLSDSLPHNQVVSFYTGSAEVLGRLRLLDQQELLPGETGWVQLRLAAPVAVAKGDHFILRSPKGTLGGGQIVEPHAKRHRRFQATLLQILATLERGNPEEILLKTLEGREPCDLRTLVAQSTLPQEQALETLSRLRAKQQLLLLGGDGREAPLRPSSTLMSISGWSRLQTKVQETLHAYHQQYPLRLGIPKEELKSRLGLATKLFDDALESLTREGVVAAEGPLLRLPHHQIQLTPAQQETLEQFQRSLEPTPYAPPSDSLPPPELLNYLVEQGKVVKVSENVVFSVSAYERMVQAIVAHLRRQGTITVGQVRDMFNTSRKYALALMEHLDERRLTRRVGDERVLRER